MEISFDTETYANDSATSSPINTGLAQDVLKPFFALQTSRGPILVDEDDRQAVENFSWYAVPPSNGNTFYAHARVPKMGGKRILMHRHLLSPPAGLVVHHKNRNGLDNRRFNLEVTTNRKNIKYAYADRSSGVYLDKNSGLWRVAIRASFGLYKNEARAREIAASLQAKLEEHLIEMEPTWLPTWKQQ